MDPMIDEQTALLPTRSVEKPTPLPRLQLSILLLLQLAEPITSQCIQPFINQVNFIINGTPGQLDCGLIVIL
jgi:hypothetical protein